MAILITTDGLQESISSKGTRLSLDEMYSLLNCSLVQAVPLKDGTMMWFDEEGKLKPHQVNLHATVLLHMAGGMPEDYIAGKALITGRNEVE